MTGYYAAHHHCLKARKLTVPLSLSISDSLPDRFEASLPLRPPTITHSYGPPQGRFTKSDFLEKFFQPPLRVAPSRPEVALGAALTRPQALWTPNASGLQHSNNRAGRFKSSIMLRTSHSEIDSLHSGLDVACAGPDAMRTRREAPTPALAPAVFLPRPGCPRPGPPPAPERPRRESSPSHRRRTSESPHACRAA